MALYNNGDSLRNFKEEDKHEEPFRSPWRRDFARLIHSPSFRRLQGKTQVFPGHESDFYRNRLTHSLEVAQVAKSIAIRLNNTNEFFKKDENQINPDIVEFAGLAHDLGHPPFGHNGEQALDECMRDFGGFEGNAQSLRIVSRLEKKAFIPGEPLIAPNGDDGRRGLNLTYRSLASLLKYDKQIPTRSADRQDPSSVSKGYYKDDSDLVDKIKINVIGGTNYEGKFKSIECGIMDIADDIAYSTYDLEDNFKAGFFTPLGLLALDEEIYVEVANTIRQRAQESYQMTAEEVASIDPSFVRETLIAVFREVVFTDNDENLPTDFWNDDAIDSSDKRALIAGETQQWSNSLADDGYQRTNFTSGLIQHFLNGIEVEPNEKAPAISKVRLNFETFLQVEVLKNITFQGVILSPNLQIVEYRGKEIVTAIFNALKDKKSLRLLPVDFRMLCKEAPEEVRMRIICDFIAGMTDRYAFEFYSRLHGSSHLTVHKPI